MTYITTHHHHNITTTSNKRNTKKQAQRHSEIITRKGFKEITSKHFLSAQAYIAYWLYNTPSDLSESCNCCEHKTNKFLVVSVSQYCMYFKRLEEIKIFNLKRCLPSHFKIKSLIAYEVTSSLQVNLHPGVIKRYNAVTIIALQLCVHKNQNNFSRFSLTKVSKKPQLSYVVSRVNSTNFFFKSGQKEQTIKFTQTPNSYFRITVNYSKHTRLFSCL